MKGVGQGWQCERGKCEDSVVVDDPLVIIVLGVEAGLSKTGNG